MTALSNRWLTAAANLTAKTWGIAAALLPEKLEIDDNRSLWISQTGDYQPTAPLKQTIEVDLAIIGGGFTGVSTAYHFSERYPEKRVALLEAKSLANGASGRNGGMMLNWLALTGDYGDELTARIYTTTHAGIQTIESIIAQHKLDGQLPGRWHGDGLHRRAARRSRPRRSRVLPVARHPGSSSTIRRRSSKSCGWKASTARSSTRIPGRSTARSWCAGCVPCCWSAASRFTRARPCSKSARAAPSR